MKNNLRDTVKLIHEKNLIYKILGNCVFKIGLNPC
jgi:hypothetical protein